MSRFDLLAVVRDEVDEEYDDALAAFVINSHMKNHPSIMSVLALADKDPANEEEAAQNRLKLQEIQEYLDTNKLPNSRMEQ